MNLKQAARHLGVHYQTAYKLVRSGRLAAVCVGARYEISEAAIERYLAERQAMRRAPARARLAPAPSDDPFAPAELALDAVAMSADTVSELAADALATVLGDLAVVREISHDGEWFLPAVVRHADPARRATIAATMGEFPMAVRGSGVLQTGRPREQRAQAARRRRTACTTASTRKRCSTSTTPGFHSMIVAPAFAADERSSASSRSPETRPAARTPASTSSPRNGPPAVVGAGIARARLTSDSWARRRSLVAAVRACSMRARADHPCRPS